MSAYSGRYYPGAAKDRKIQKREEAEIRQATSAAIKANGGDPYVPVEEPSLDW